MSLSSALLWTSLCGVGIPNSLLDQQFQAERTELQLKVNCSNSSLKKDLFSSYTSLAKGYKWPQSQDYRLEISAFVADNTKQIRGPISVNWHLTRKGEQLAQGGFVASSYRSLTDSTLVEDRRTNGGWIGDHLLELSQYTSNFALLSSKRLACRELPAPHDRAGRTFQFPKLSGKAESSILALEVKGGKVVGTNITPITDNSQVEWNTGLGGIMYFAQIKHPAGFRLPVTQSQVLVEPSSYRFGTYRYTGMFALAEILSKSGLGNLVQLVSWQEM